MTRASDSGDARSTEASACSVDSDFFTWDLAMTLCYDWLQRRSTSQIVTRARPRHRLECLILYSVENVGAGRVPLWHVGMLEVAGDIAAHSEALHDPPGTHVDGRCEGDDFVETGGVEAVVESSQRPFGGVTVSPLVSGEPPADLHRRGKVGGKRGRPEADVADEAFGVLTLHGPETVSALCPALTDARDESLGALLRVGLREELHDARVRIHRDEWLQIRVTPFPEHQPVRHDHRDALGWVQRGLRADV